MGPSDCAVHWSLAIDRYQSPDIKCGNAHSHVYHPVACVPFDSAYNATVNGVRDSVTARGMCTLVGLCSGSTFCVGQFIQAADIPNG